MFNRIIKKINRLQNNVTTNAAEKYMALVAKFTGGKRTNLIMGDTYEARCQGAALSYNKDALFHKFASNKNKIFLNNFCSRRLKIKKKLIKK